MRQGTASFTTRPFAPALGSPPVPVLVAVAAPKVASSPAALPRFRHLRLRLSCARAVPRCLPIRRACLVPPKGRRRGRNLPTGAQLVKYGGYDPSARSRSPSWSLPPSPLFSHHHPSFPLVSPFVPSFPLPSSLFFPPCSCFATPLTPSSHLDASVDSYRRSVVSPTAPCFPSHSHSLLFTAHCTSLVPLPSSILLSVSVIYTWHHICRAWFARQRWAVTVAPDKAECT